MTAKPPRGGGVRPAGAADFAGLVILSGLRQPEPIKATKTAACEILP